MQNIALFGGSFNPPHPGHFEIACNVCESLEVDEVWFLFSENWQKDPAKYVSVEHRIEMGRILAHHYPDKPFVMSDIQNELGTHITHEVLAKLRDRFRDTRFIWVMGADSFRDFHTWKNFRAIIENHAIAVIGRPGYTEDARGGITAVAYRNFNLVHPQYLTDRENGWCFLDSAGVNMSSSALLAEMRGGKVAFDGAFQDVADYILEHALYGLGPALNAFSPCDPGTPK